MKPSKFKVLTKVLLKKNISAMKKLLKYYTTENAKDFDECPLCRANSVSAYSFVTCETCPWLIMSKDKNPNNFLCEQTSRKMNRCGAGLARYEKRKDWVKMRIPQLRTWIKAYQRELNKRDNA